MSQGKNPSTPAAPLGFAAVKRAAAGRWDSILPALGIPTELMDGRHHFCLGCGGVDRARWDRQKERFYCSQGGGELLSTDGFGWLVHAGITRDAGEALRLVAVYLGMDAKSDPVARQKAKEAARKREQARLEEALHHELLILLQVLSTRISGRKLARDSRFREARPDWQPMPEGAWERERLAVQRITALLAKLYRPSGRKAA